MLLRRHRQRHADADLQLLRRRVRYGRRRERRDDRPLLERSGAFRYTSTAAAASAAGNRHNIAQFWRGNAAGLGGFFFVAQFGIATFQSGMAAFVGMGPAAALGNVNPNTLLNCCGFAFDNSAGQTTWQFQSNDGTGTATQVNTGLAANASGTNWYEAPHVLRTERRGDRVEPSSR